MTHWNGSSPITRIGHNLPSEVVIKTEPVSVLGTEMEAEVRSMEYRDAEEHRELQLGPLRTVHSRISEMGKQESENCTMEAAGFEINFKTEPNSDTESDNDMEANSDAMTGQRLVKSGVVVNGSVTSYTYSERLESELGAHDEHWECSHSLNLENALLRAHAIKSESVSCMKFDHGTETNQSKASSDFLPEVTQNQEGKDSKSKPFVCSECPSAFPFRSHLDRHRLRHDQNADRPFSCKTCKARFKLRCHLKQHTLTHTGERPFACKECKAAFARSDHLKQHAQTHAGLKPYLCTACSRTFTQVAHLRKHMIRHSDDRVVWCKIKACKAVFTSVNELEKHRKTHVEDRICKECGVVLSRADDMKKHVRIHTKDKPYSCSVCCARFSQAGHLTTHQMQHTGEKPFSCELCGCGFKQSHHLKRHMEVHNGERPFSCKVCNASFKRSSSLTRHKQKCRRPTPSTLAM